MIPEVCEGVVQFDQCTELFEDPEDDDEKPLLPAGPSKRKDEPGKVRRRNSTSHTSTGLQLHTTCCHAFLPNSLLDSFGLLPCPTSRAPLFPLPLLWTQLPARMATDKSSCSCSPFLPTSCWASYRPTPHKDSGRTLGKGFRHCATFEWCGSHMG